MPLGPVKRKDAVRPARSRAKVAEDPDLALARRLREAIGVRPINEVARTAGISDPLLRAYLKGSKPSAEKLARISTALGVNLDWLILGDGPVLAPTALRSGFGARELVLIPVFDLIAAAAPGAFDWRPEGEPVARVALPLSAVTGALKCTPEALAAVPVVGRCMEPMYREGEVALIDRSRTEVPPAGAYFLLRIAAARCESGTSGWRNGTWCCPLHQRGRVPARAAGHRRDVVGPGPGADRRHPARSAPRPPRPAAIRILAYLGRVITIL